MRIFHITEPEAEVGYVHCSFPEQVERVMGFVYGPIPLDAVVDVRHVQR